MTGTHYLEKGRFFKMTRKTKVLLALHKYFFEWIYMKINSWIFRHCDYEPEDYDPIKWHREHWERKDNNERRR